MNATGEKRIRVWDAPVRLFHWALVLLVTFSFVTGNIGGNLMMWHMWSGYWILALVTFRILWGFFGSTTARFGNFMYGPAAIIAYMKSMLSKGYVFHAGHNPMGGLSVIALLGSLLLQAVTGLFADDDISTKGPLADKVSGKIVSLATQIHSVNQVIILILIGVHLAAILFYLFYKRENLVHAMFSGHKKTSVETVSPDLKFTNSWIALVLFGIAAGVVYYVVTIK